MARQRYHRNALPHRTLRRGMRGNDVRRFQLALRKRLANSPFKGLKVSVDGQLGDQSVKAWHHVRWIIGLPASSIADGHELTPGAQLAVRQPWTRNGRAKETATARRRRAERDRFRSSEWGGSRTVTNEVVAIVNGRAGITSRKRSATDPLSRGNPGSDHNMANATADAVDFGIANAFSLAREIAAKLGAPNEWTGDFDSFNVVRDGRTYRVQLIAGTHGTGPHLHVGVRLA